MYSFSPLELPLRNCVQLSHSSRIPLHPPISKKVCVGVDPYLHNLILELGKEEVDNLVLLDGQRVEVDLLHGGDLAGLDETAELGDGLPLLLLLLGATTAATATTATSTLTTTVAARTETTTSTGSSVSHIDVVMGSDGEGCRD